jgi:outer membrane receptor for ferrienterochelin and colicins
MARFGSIVLCLLWAATVLGQAPGKLSGKVLDGEGVAVVGANVVLESAALTGGKTGSVTDDEGRFSFASLPVGRYVVKISHIGYSELVRAGVQVPPGGQLALDLILKDAIIFLDQNVVSASRRQEKILDAPASVAVVEAEDIRSQPTLSVVEHIRDLPAVDFSQTGLAQSNVVVRGFNNIFSGALLTLTDNRIARVPSIRLNAYNFIPVTSEDIERIELVLGPGSALYGPNSANGVMHIITQSPLSSQGTDVSMGVGERSVRKLALRHAGKVGEKFGYKVSTQYYAGTDWKYQDPVEVQARAAALAAGADPATTNIGARDFDIDRQSAELRMDYRHSDELTAIFAAGYNNANNLDLTGLGAGQARDWAGGYYQARVLYRDWFFQAFRNWSDAGDTFLLRDGAPIVDKSTLTVYQVQHSAAIGQRQRFTYGADALLTRPDTDGSINGANENDDDINEYGAYLQSETSLTEKLDLVLAIRYDDHNRVEDAEISPRAGLVFKPRDTQTLRLTYNRAFSTPSNNNLYLDLNSSRDPFGLSAFGAALPFTPTIDVRAQGTYRSGFNDGFTFLRSGNGRPQFRSPFAPAVGLSTDQYIDMDDPDFTKVMWNIGRGAVFNGLNTPLFSQVVTSQIQAIEEVDIETAQIASQNLLGSLVALVPGELSNLQNALLKLNLDSTPGAPPFLPADDAFDVPRTRSTITETYEFGYKGVIGNKLVVAADLYHTKTSDFVGPLAVETPNVFLKPESVAASLSAEIATLLEDPANAGLLQALAPLDYVNVPNTLQGNENGNPVDEIVTLFAGGTARIPFGTVSPEQAYDPTAVLLTYRNFGEVTTNGLDLSLAYYPTPALMLMGNFSYVDDSFFKNVDGIADIALNAPSSKVKMGGSYLFKERGLRLGGQLRYSGSFRQDSGVYVGDVDSYAVLDLNIGYKLPVERDLRLTLDVANALDNSHREFAGAPEIGRMSFLQLGASF